jgi:F-type H+-transporting ATPase subunit b
VSGLIPNTSLFIQIGLFIFLMIVLNQIFFKPFLRFLEERQQKIEGEEREAARLREEAESRRLRVEEGLNKGQLQAADAKRRILDAGQQEGKAFVDKAQKEIDAEVPRIKAQIDQEGRQVAAELERRQGQMAREIAEKILGRGLR